MHRNKRCVGRESATGFLFFMILVGGSLSACIQPDPKVWKLDVDYGFRGYNLGPSLYSKIFQQAEERAAAYEVVEFETFGSRFADQQLFEQHGKNTVFGYPVSNAFAGVIDKTVYAFLLQVEVEESEQAALADSLVFHYGPPQSTVDTTYTSGETVVKVKTSQWTAKMVGMELGQGEGFAEVLVYDIGLRQKRERIHQLMARSHRNTNVTVNGLESVGEVDLDEVASRARWKYRYRGEETHVRGGSFGEIDYSYVQPFFEVEGKSFFGVKMAFVNLNFLGGSDSLKSIEVRFDNTQGQTIGFMDMLRVMERKLGRHGYSDTLHTPKGPFRRASWYGEDLTITLEENRFRPENPDRADVVVSFDIDRIEVPWRPPDLATETPNLPDSLDIGSGGGTDSLSTRSDLIGVGK